MNAKYILLLSAAALMALGCQKEVENFNEKENEAGPIPGQEVSFGATLTENAETKTIYGAENDNAFPILWLKGDQVYIASPQCASGANQATYQVSDGADRQKKAGTLSKVGETGIQWGEAATVDFYSFYPQRAGDYEIKTASGFSATNATFELNMPATQTCVVEATSGSPKMTTADMNACFMYAKNAGVVNGTTPVELQYSPLSTAIRFTLRGPKTQGQTVAVSRIRLIGPSNAALSGKFQVRLDGETPVVTPVSGQTSNIVVVYARDDKQAYLQLSYGQSIELNAFIIPMDGMRVDGDWKLELTLAGGKRVTKTLTPASSSSNTNLLAGMIHRLGNMPYLPSDQLDITKWMEFIPRNVYLSELSLPGSWNSLNKDFQTQATSEEAGSEETEDISKKTIDQQYALGCRAFHLDTRYRRTSAAATTFSNLGIANGGDNADVLASGKKVMKERACPLFSEALGYITANVKQTEYMVVICTFAQNSHQDNNQDWRRKVSDACASNDAVYDASQISANTTVNDVLGKVIVIVNCEGTTPTISGSKCLFVNAPLTLSASTFTSGYPTETLYKGNGVSGLSLNYVQAQITSNTTGFDTGTGSPLSPIRPVFIGIGGWDGENRGFAPNLTQRQTIGGNILTWSSQNVTSQNYQHKDWIFLGLGGYLIKPKTTRLSRTDYYYDWETVSDSYGTVASNLNNWINGKVTAMDTNKQYYPVGIVLMNKVKESGTDWSSPETIENIVYLNNKFHKAFDPTKPEWPGQGGDVQSAAPGYSSGMVDNNTNAISAN